MSQCENVGSDGAQIPAEPVVLEVLSPLPRVTLAEAIRGEVTGVRLQARETRVGIQLSVMDASKEVIEDVKKALEGLGCRIFD